MKNLLYILLLIPFGILAQTPKVFNYQAVIRNSNGNLVASQQVSIKISLLNGSATGFPDYIEQHGVATNGYGVASIVIGEGTPITGTYNTLAWSSVDYYLKTELDIQGNGNYQFMGTKQLVAVPYAIHAESANYSMNDGDTSSTNELQQLSLQGNQLILSNGGAVSLTTTVDLDPDPSNELQVLSISGDTLHLSQGNFIVLPPDGDNNPTNEIQSLSNTSGTISLSNSNTITLEDSSAVNELQTLSNTAGTISISSGNTITLVDSSATNELQTLSQTAGTISISSGNTIVVVDSSATNELQSLSVVGTDSLKISEGNTIKIPTGPPNLDNSSTNELQILSISHQDNSISISNGNTVSLPTIPPNNDNDASNELQNLTYSNDTLSISNGNNVVIENENFDWLYPDGKKDITPLISISNNYSPPSGKRLYVTSLYSETGGFSYTDTIIFNYVGFIESYIVPNGTSSLVISARGAEGGAAFSSTLGGRGAKMEGEFNVSSNQVLKIVVGEKGESSSTYRSGGGGGSFVWLDGASTPLIVAGGGGGGGNPNTSQDGVVSQNGQNGGSSSNSYPSGNGGTNGAGGSSGTGGNGFGHAGGGGGWLSNGGGTFGGIGGLNFSRSNGNTYGGFGGGGGINNSGGGGGGGYSGGGGSGWGYNNGSGGGGGSFNIGTNQNNQSGENSGNGSVTIMLKGSNSMTSFKIDTSTIYQGFANYNSYGTIKNPLILDANNTFNYGNDTIMSASGFLINADADYIVVNSALNNTTGSGSGIYTVPTGKILVVLNLYSEGSIYAKPPNSSAITICDTQNSASGNSVNITKKPIFLNEGDKIYGVGTFNGYLMDK